jgi:hypothetical protein
VYPVTDKAGQGTTKVPVAAPNVGDGLLTETRTSCPLVGKVTGPKDNAPLARDTAHGLMQFAPLNDTFTPEVKLLPVTVTVTPVAPKAKDDAVTLVMVGTILLTTR